MTTFVWQINFMQVMPTPEPDTVVLSNYTVFGTDTGITASLTYSTTLLPANPSHFTPYDQITEAQAIEWTQAALGPAGVAEVESQVQSAIDYEKSPHPTVIPLPWA